MLTEEEKAELKALGIDLDAEDSGDDEQEEKKSKTAAAKKESDDSDDDDEDDDDQDDEKEEASKPETKEEEKPEPASSAQDRELYEYAKRLEERNREYEAREREAANRERERTSREQDSRSVEQKKADSERDATRVLTDLDAENFGKRFEALERQNKMYLNTAKIQEKNLAESAYSQIKNKYPDFDDFIKPEARQAALRAVLDSPDTHGGFGQPWVEEYEKAYRQLSFDKHYSEKKVLGQKADELGKKRDEKKSKEKVKVLPSGSSFQSPSARTSSKDAGEGYGSLRDDALRMIVGD